MTQQQSRGAGLRAQRPPAPRSPARNVLGLLAALLTGPLLAGAALAAEAGAVEPEPSPPWLRYVDNAYYEISLNVRARVEVAEVEGLETSQAWTVRTRAGIGSKPFHGFTGYAEVENLFTFDSHAYWDVVSTPNGKSPIADPPDTELNRLWLRYQNPEWLGLDVKAGRQWIVLDDSRWVGNVGWRQIDQTFDAARVGSSFGLDGLEATYAYVWEVNRIFGDQGPPATQDFDSQSSLIHVHYGKLPGGAALTGFAYLLDFQNSPGNSSNSYGLRLTGSHALSDTITLGYAGSYAYQTDAGDNPVDYAANYVSVEGSLGYAPAGTLTLVYELLGSDDGKARVVTPLATAHKFNGYADVFLNNGGPNGLQDLAAQFAPKLPYGLAGFVTYHHFWNAENGTDLGDEVDFSLKRAFGRYFEVLAKGGYFMGTRSGPPDTWRYWLQVTFAY